jgi:hypothetical protein
MQENYVFDVTTSPVQGKPLDEIDGVIKAKIATGLVEDTRVKTARPNPAAAAAPADREIVQDTRILTATPTPKVPGEPLTKFTEAVPPPTTARASQETKTDINLQAPPPILATPKAPVDPALAAAQYKQAQLSAQASNPSPPPQGSTSAK